MKARGSACPFFVSEFQRADFSTATQSNSKFLGRAGDLMRVLRIGAGCFLMCLQLNVCEMLWQLAAMRHHAASPRHHRK